MTQTARKDMTPKCSPSGNRWAFVVRDGIALVIAVLGWLLGLYAAIFDLAMIALGFGPRKFEADAGGGTGAATDATGAAYAPGPKVPADSLPRSRATPPGHVTGSRRRSTVGRGLDFIRLDPARNRSFGVPTLMKRLQRHAGAVRSIERNSHRMEILDDIDPKSAVERNVHHGQSDART